MVRSAEKRERATLFKESDILVSETDHLLLLCKIIDTVNEDNMEKEMPDVA